MAKKKPAARKRPPAQGADPKRPPKKRPPAAAGGGKRKPLKHRRRGDYNYADHGKGGGGLPPGDLTVKESANVELVRPDFDHADSLIFRMLPALTDEFEDQSECKYLPYRNSLDPYQYTDFIRSYPAARYLGFGDDCYTFLLYDKAVAAREGYDRKQNPYIILYNAVAKSIKDKTAPSIKWVGLIQGGDRVMNKPTFLYFTQGLIFKRGSETYVGAGRAPKGAGTNDKPQIIQLTVSAGKSLEQLMNGVNPEWDGSESNFEKAMEFGDVVHPKFGRFVRVQNLKKLAGAPDASLEDQTSWEMGGDSYEDKKSGDSDYRGYDVRLDDVFVTNERRTKLKPTLTPAASQALKKSVVWWDDVLRVPTQDELCLIIAKSMRGAREVLEFGWQDHPEFFTSDVNAVLSNAVQVFGGREDGDLEYEDEPAAPARDRRRSAVVPPAEAEGGYDDEYDENEEYEGDEAEEVTEAKEGAEAAEGKEGEYAEGYDDAEDGEYEDEGAEGAEAVAGEEEYGNEEYDDAEPAADEGGYAEEGAEEKHEDAAAGEEPQGAYDGEDYEDDPATGGESQVDPAAADDEYDDLEDDYPDAESQDADEAEMEAAFDAANERSSARAPKQTARKRPPRPEGQRPPKKPPEGAPKRQRPPAAEGEAPRRRKRRPAQPPTQAEAPKRGPRRRPPAPAE